MASQSQFTQGGYFNFRKIEFFLIGFWSVFVIFPIIRKPAFVTNNIKRIVQYDALPHYMNIEHMV